MPTTIDPCTCMILDFIAGGPNIPANPIGESKGNYNAYFGHADSTKDLSQMSLATIYAFQDAIYRQNGVSTAIGRYQFLKGTLQDLAKAKKLPPSTLFTPELQDDLAVALLVRRGYSDWWKGEMDDASFANGLSQEWASLPSPEKGGRSYYDGEAGNHASTTLKAVYAMLAEARKLKDQPTPAPEPIPPPTPEPTIINKLTSQEQEALAALENAYDLVYKLPGMDVIANYDTECEYNNTRCRILAAVAIRLLNSKGNSDAKSNP